MLVQVDPLREMHALRRGDVVNLDRVFPSAEAASAYEVVRSHLRQRERAGLTSVEARAEFARRWPHLPWGRMGYWAMVKTAARLLTS